MASDGYEYANLGLMWARVNRAGVLVDEDDSRGNSLMVLMQCVQKGGRSGPIN